MKRGLIDAIFWKLHTSYLRNERKSADMFLGMLEDEGKRSSIKDEIGQIHYARFELIQANIQNGSYGRLYGYGFETPYIDPFTNKEASGDEAEFHKKLITKSGRQCLYDCLNIDFWAGMLHEVEMDPYGRCDFVIREGRTTYAIECKMGEAKSAVVGQIDKYRLALELEMSMGMSDRVIAVVVAETFTPYVAGELSRLSVRMIQHNGQPESLKEIAN